MAGDAVGHPSHYSGAFGVECMDAMANMVGRLDGEEPVCPVSHAASYWWVSALKYLWRWPYKNGIEDLRKAEQCIRYCIDETVGDEG